MNNSGFEKVRGGYSRKISDITTEFIPDMCAKSFDAETGSVEMYKPDYAALEAAKAPAVVATEPGVYSYYDEMQKAPTGCDFRADLAYYGEHFYLWPLRPDAPVLKGRGITKEKDGYCVTIRAYEILKTKYKISLEMCFD